MIIRALLLTLLLGLSIQQQPTKIGYAYAPNPDVIKCDKFFYYLMTTSPTLSKFNAFSGTGDVESYDSSNGVLSNKVGKLAGDCSNETIESLWEKNRAFRLFNLNRAPNKSIQDNENIPDVIQCQNGTLLYRDSTPTGSMWYRNPTGPFIRFSSTTFAIERSSTGLTCDNKSLNTLIAENRAFKIATQAAPAGMPSISMTGKYPDFIKCAQQDLYIYQINDDQTQVQYRNPINIQVSITFVNGAYSSDQLGFLFLTDCINKSLEALRGQGKLFNLNTPMLECPKDITSSNPIVPFKATSNANLQLSYSHQSNSSFPIGQQTTVTVTGSNSVSNFNLQCTFKVTIQGSVQSLSDSGSDSGSDNQVILIASIVSGVVVLAGIIIMIIAIERCRRKKKGCFREKKKIDIPTNVQDRTVLNQKPEV